MRAQQPAQTALGALLRQPFALMGILNVTPDSFSDGGAYAARESAISHGLAMAEAGADVIDVGGESTRPGSQPVSEEEETRRVVPVIEELARRCDRPISVDTSKSGVARRALAGGATWVNDVSAGRFDPRMPVLIGENDCIAVLMHSRETPQTMQKAPHYNDPMGEVVRELLQQVAVFIGAGVSKDRIVIDPGIGFAKRTEDNIAILRGLRAFVDTGYPVLIGTSRKSFIGQITGKPVDERMSGSLGSVAAAYVNGAKIFRVHDVAETRDCLKVLAACLSQ